MGWRDGTGAHGGINPGTNRARIETVAVNQPVIGHIAPFSLRIGFGGAGEGGVRLPCLLEIAPFPSFY